MPTGRPSTLHVQQPAARSPPTPLTAAHLSVCPLNRRMRGCGARDTSSPKRRRRRRKAGMGSTRAAGVTCPRESGKLLSRPFVQSPRRPFPPDATSRTLAPQSHSTGPCAVSVARKVKTSRLPVPTCLTYVSILCIFMCCATLRFIQPFQVSYFVRPAGSWNDAGGHAAVVLCLSEVLLNALVCSIPNPKPVEP